MSAPESALLTESFGALNLPLGGKHGYHGVRGRQGSKQDGFQGYTPRKTHFTKVYKTAHEAAVDLALLKRDREMNSEDEDEKKPRKALSRGCGSAASDAARAGGARKPSPRPALAKERSCLRSGVAFAGGKRTTQ